MEICKRNVTSYTNGRLKKYNVFFSVSLSCSSRVQKKKGFSDGNVCVCVCVCMCMRMLSCRIFTARKSDLLVHLLPLERLNTYRKLKANQTWRATWCAKVCVSESLSLDIYIYMWKLRSLIFHVRGCKRPLSNHMLTLSTHWKQNLLESYDFDCYEYEDISKRRQ